MYLMVLDGEYPKDIRVRKEAESIAESGREITVLTRWKKTQARKEKINNVIQTNTANTTENNDD